jgi:hypothetical protein
VHVYTVADYFDMDDLKIYARQGVADILHVYWQYKGLDLADALEEAFTSTPDEDTGIRDVLVDAMKDHPGLVVDEGDVEDWLEEHPEVRERVHWDDYMKPLKRGGENVDEKAVESAWATRRTRFGISVPSPD